MEGKKCPHCKSKDTELVISCGHKESWECFNCKKTFFFSYIRGGIIDKL